MASTAYQSAADWKWPNDIPAKPAPTTNNQHATMPGAFRHDSPLLETREPSPPPKMEATHPQAPKSSRVWPPRQCRICLEVVLPTFQQPSGSLPDLLQSAPSVTYESEDPASGRLVRPCKCKGSSRYVHEGCLHSWRHADPSYGKRNYWQCPTCGFRYRLERMAWGRAISSASTQIILTLSIFLLAMFILGFIADPIINFYLDPYSTFSSAPLSKLNTKIEPLLTDDEDPSWLEHFLKGLASLGLLSFIKVLLAMSPWQWWNLRSSGIMSSSGRGNTGRERLASTTWILILIGVGTFLWAVYKGVRAWSRRTLEKASERVMDVPLDDEEE